MIVKKIPNKNPFTNILLSSFFLKKYLFIVIEIKIIPHIQIPFKGCMLINKAENKPPRNRFPESNNPKIQVANAKLIIP